jgi:hypothetical protein
MQGQFYRAFVDSAGGAIGGDSYSIAIAHREDNKYVVDVCRGRPGPFDSQDVTREYAELCGDYRIQTVVRDHYSAAWVQQAWRDHGITYATSDLSASQLYLESLPIFTRGLVARAARATIRSFGGGVERQRLVKGVLVGTALGCLGSAAFSNALAPGGFGTFCERLELECAETNSKIRSSQRARRANGRPSCKWRGNRHHPAFVIVQRTHKAVRNSVIASLNWAGFWSMAK